MRLELAELDMEEVELTGALQIHADCPLGKRDDSGVLVLSEHNGKCTLRRVIVRNAGINHQGSSPCWSHKVHCRESLNIRIHGDGEFLAEGVLFEGSQTIEVADGEKVTATNNSAGHVVLRREKLQQPSWRWHYTIDDASNISLRR